VRIKKEPNVRKGYGCEARTDIEHAAKFQKEWGDDNIRERELNTYLLRSAARKENGETEVISI